MPIPEKYAWRNGQLLTLPPKTWSTTLVLILKQKQSKWMQEISKDDPYGSKPTKRMAGTGLPIFAPKTYLIKQRF